MKVLITGAKGFVGQNLVAFLKILQSQKESLNLNTIIDDIYEFDKDSSYDELDTYCRDCDFVFNLAGVNRPENNDEFAQNFNFVEALISLLKKHNNNCPIMFSSSIQAELDNEYGKSKKTGEDLIFAYGRENNIKTFIYRFPNLFGKWCRPNYNSVIATWCYNISHNIDIVVNDPSKTISLAYIDDVCYELMKCLENKETRNGDFCCIPVIYKKTLGDISSAIKSFKENARGIMVPNTGDDFIKKLYATYISYVPLQEMIVDLEEHRDNRGIFCELVKTKDSGQVSVSTTNPSIIRGGHFHHTKMERFIVIKGKAKITFEHVITKEKQEFEVSGDKLQYVTIPVGYQHSIDNIGDEELILVLWANELFDPLFQDTYKLEEFYEKK